MLFLIYILKFHASTSLVWSNLTFYQIVVKIPATLSEWQKIDFVKKNLIMAKKQNLIELKEKGIGKQINNLY